MLVTNAICFTDKTEVKKNYLILSYRNTTFKRCYVEMLLSFVQRPCVTPVFSETAKRIHARFCGKVPIDHISIRFLTISILKNNDFLSFYVDKGPHENDDLK